VRSRAQLDYPTVQRDADAGKLPEPLASLPDVGRLLTERGLARGAINLPLPEQELESDGDGWRLVLRAQLPVEEHNAQVSLLTGACAAAIMLDGGMGLLRTMPPPRREAVDRLRSAARALGVAWPSGAGPGEVIAAVDTGQARGAAFLDHAAELMRGAGYTAFDGQPPDRAGHGGVGAPYAHVTAPLRRLADRYATEVCLALAAGRPVPDWAREALPRLPKVMADTDRVASAAERGAIDLAEATVLAGRVGERFDVAVIDVDEPHAPAPAPAVGRLAAGPVPSGPISEARREGRTSQAPEPARADRTPASSGSPPRRPGGTVALDSPAVRARCEGDLPLGERVEVRLVTADPQRRLVLFARP
jgi:exoribonuclease R